MFIYIILLYDIRNGGKIVAVDGDAAWRSVYCRELARKKKEEGNWSARSLKPTTGAYGRVRACSLRATSGSVCECCIRFRGNFYDAAFDGSPHTFSWDSPAYALVLRAYTAKLRRRPFSLPPYISLTPSSCFPSPAPHSCAPGVYIYNIPSVAHPPNYTPTYSRPNSHPPDREHPPSRCQRRRKYRFHSCFAFLWMNDKPIACLRAHSLSARRRGPQ